jgi:hypothetical protein
VTPGAGLIWGLGLAVLLWLASVCSRSTSSPPGSRVMSWQQPVLIITPLARWRKLACLGVVTLWSRVAI